MQVGRRLTIQGQPPGTGAMRDEAELIRASAAGDLEAFEELMLLKRERVYRMAYQVVRNADDARDVAQQVFVRLWKVIRRYRAERKFDTWLHRITVNLAIDFRRRHAHRDAEVPLDETGAAAGVPLAMPPGTPASLLGDPGEQVLRAELRRIYEALAGELTERQRTIFVMREAEGLPAEEIGRILGITASTVRNTVFQARAILRSALRRRFPDYAPRDPDSTRPGRKPGPGSGGQDESGGETT